MAKPGRLDVGVMARPRAKRQLISLQLLAGTRWFLRPPRLGRPESS